MQCNKLSLNVGNAKGLNTFKNKTNLSYHYNLKMVEAGASAATGSSNGVVCV